MTDKADTYFTPGGFVFRFLRWITGWGDLIDGLCLIVTLGFWCPEVVLITTGWFLDYCWYQGRRWQRKQALMRAIAGISEKEAGDV